MSVVFEKPSDLSEYLFRILDNGGSSVDRYTIMFSDDSYLALNKSPTHPQGFSQSGEGMDPATAQEWVEEGQAVDLALGDLPPGLVEHILYRNNEGLADFLKSVEDKDKHAVAPTRDKAEVNEGISTSLGKGIYDSPEGYRIRLDGEPEDDRGPFTTAREAVLNSLPDQYAYAGEEYHSSMDLMRLEPSQEVMDRIAELEAKRETEWEAEMAEQSASRGM